MKKFIVLIILIIISQVLFSQDKLSEEKIQVGEACDAVISRYSRYYNYEEYILSVKFYKKEIILQTFDSKSLKQLNKNVFAGFPKEVAIEEIMRIKNKMILFYSLYDEEKDKESLYSREIDVEKSSFEDNVKLVLEVKADVDPIKNNQAGVDNFDISISDSQDKLFIQYKIKTKKNEFSKIGLKTLNLEYEIESEIEVELPYTSFKMYNVDFVVDKGGVVNMLSFIYRDETSRRVNGKGKINYDVELFKFSANEEKFSQTKIKIDSNQHINEIKIFKFKNGEIMCAGYTSIIGRDDKWNQTSGVFTLNILDGEVSTNLYSIPFEIAHQNIKTAKINMNNSMQKRYGKHFKPTIDFLVPEMLYKCDDGGVLMVGEQQKPIVRNYGGYAHSAHMLYEDVLFTKINKDGSLSWMKKLAKRQETTNRIKFDGLDKKGMSFKYVEGGTHLYFLYSDHIKNLNLDNLRIPKKNDYVFEGAVTSYKIDLQSGESKKTSIFEVQNIKGMKTERFSLSRATSFINDEFIVEVFENVRTSKDVLLKRPNANEYLIRVDLK